jgi:hypothetical protein
VIKPCFAVIGPVAAAKQSLLGSSVTSLLLFYIRGKKIKCDRADSANVDKAAQVNKQNATLGANQAARMEVFRA